MTTGARPIRLLLTGGGTGGHLFPAIAAAEEMCHRCPGAQVLFIGTRKKMDRTGLSQYGFAVKSVFSYGLKGKSLPNLIKAIAALPIGFAQALVHILAFRPDVVLGVGGYVTGPVMAAAKMLGRKTLIHEQNSVPGLANRKLGGLVDRICISLPQSATFFPAGKTVLTGNPVRRSLLEVAEAEREEEVREAKTLLILGGSQGAHRLNQLVVEALCEHGVATPLRVIHQTGSADCEEVRKRYEEKGIDAQVEPFFRDMAAIYSSADLLVSRAGATTLAEISVLGKPAILVPFPFAADNHQEKNAGYYVEGGGCRSYTEKDLSGEMLARQVAELLGDDERRRAMASCLRQLAQPQAAAKIVDVCLAMLAK